MNLEKYIESGELKVIDNLSDQELEDLKLEDDEYLLKINSSGMGFMTKKNKTGTVPVAWLDWENYGNNNNNHKSFIIKESFRKGWKLIGHRLGKSQAWAKVKHPFGFTMEVNLAGIIDTLQKSELEYGEFMVSMKYHQAGKTKQLQSLLDL